MIDQHAMTTIEVRCGNRDWTFENDPGVSLLDQLTAHSAPISYSCRRGDCGQCSVSLIEGKAEPLEARYPLWQSDSLLSCNAIMVTPVKIRIPYDPELDGIEVRRSPAKIQAIGRLSDDVVELTLRLPPANEIRFLPGQYIRITNREGTMRSYSLAAGPASDRMLRVHIRRVDGGAFSDWLFGRAAVNELLHVEGPQGRFFLRDIEVKQSVFLATGTGIAPIWAMLSSATEKQLQAMGSASIYWGNRHRSDAYMMDRLESLASRIGSRFHCLYSREAGVEAGAHRHVQSQMIADHPRLDDAQIFACGNAAMIESAREIALASGLPEQRFHSDPFTAS